ncbi:MAG: YbdK family carboxylate-amine ligase, partial [Actinobacteria bacterium]|nr:YbdK family carboxylate-amine ligase [Actinomycetota bacterium]
MIAHEFGRGGEWTVGVEEELFVLDAQSLAPAAVRDEMLDGRTMKRELFAAVLELNTGVCASVVEAGEELAALRDDAKRRAAAAGLALAAVGTWPTAVAEEQAVTQDDGYLAFVEYAGSSARRQFCSGLHVHVAVPSPEACMRTLEAVLPWLPVVLAVSANSPYVAGRETGLASTRAETLALLPRSAAPPVFASYGEWERFAEGLVELGLADEWTRIWWDVRPHPRFGTLEVRMPDQPTRVEVTIAFTALLQALVASASPGPPADRGLYAQNRWAALRFGGSARLVHPRERRLVEAHELLAELVAALRPMTVRLGTTALRARLDGVGQAVVRLSVAGGPVVRLGGGQV